MEVQCLHLYLPYIIIEPTINRLLCKNSIPYENIFLAQEQSHVMSLPLQYTRF